MTTADSSPQTAGIGANYLVGQTYRDTGAKNNPEDEFLKRLAADGLTIANAGGIRWRDHRSLRLLDPESGTRIPAYVVLVTAEKATQFHNPWDDFIDQNGGDILYWGDAKFKERGPRFDRFPGNSRLVAINNLRLARKLSLIPPILHFSKPAAGQIRFNGLCTLTGMQVSWFEDQGRPVKNLRAVLSILDLEELSIPWLHDRVLATSESDMDGRAPDVWKAAGRGRVEKRQVWAAKIRDRKAQEPVAGSDDARLIEEIRSLTPYEFECFVVSMLEKIEEIIPGLNHRIIQTRQTGDHGVDFYGSFTLPAPIQYEISFVGQAKRYQSSVTPDEVSRLVARLGRGQYGLFFTTSSFTEQAQREVLVDRYPVRLFSATDIVNILREANCASGDRLKPDWKIEALKRDMTRFATGLVPIIP